MVETGKVIDCSNELIELIIGIAIEVHRELGPGLLESVYEQALVYELCDAGLDFERQVDIPVFYKGKKLGTGFRADLIINGHLLLELKSIDKFTPVHVAQVITYLKLAGIKRGFLLNFNEKLLKHGIKRISI